MSGDWIKIRPSLLLSPKVNAIAKQLEESREVGQVLSTGFNGPMCEIVKRNVMRNVTLASLVTIWGAANEHTSDGVFRNADLSDIDDMVGIPGFGEAMEAVGWAKLSDDGNSVILPNFNEYNTCGKDRAKEKNAERQRRYRERQKEKSDDNSNVSRNVTNNVEKRREEKKKRNTKEKSEWALPDGIDPTLWGQFEAHRKALKKPMTDQARTLNANVLLSLSPEQQRRSVEAAIKAGWTGLFPPKDNIAQLPQPRYDRL